MCVNEFIMFHDGVVKTIRKFVFECKIMHDRLVFQIDGGDKKNCRFDYSSWILEHIAL